MTPESTKTEVGSYFISNYPPFSQWTADQVPEALQALESPLRDVPLGLYLHIPFCRKRCKFCYFRVYTDKNASEIETYLSALSREIELLSRVDLPHRFRQLTDKLSRKIQIFEHSWHPLSPGLLCCFPSLCLCG